ncbi:hypothetical protein H0H92_007877, partial [Tricholoma furcatifolium]
ADYCIAFSILTITNKDPTFPDNKIVNIIVNYIYIGLLIMWFILSPGNHPRPWGSKWEYTTALVGYAAGVVYMTVSESSILLS